VGGREGGREGVEEDSWNVARFYQNSLENRLEIIQRIL